MTAISPEMLKKLPNGTELVWVTKLGTSAQRFRAIKKKDVNNSALLHVFFDEFPESRRWSYATGRPTGEWSENLFIGKVWLELE